MFTSFIPDEFMYWVLSCGGLMMGSLFSDIAGVFGAVQEKRAAGEAMRILNEAKQQAMNESANLSQMFDPFVTSAQSNLNMTAGLLQKFIAQTEGVQVDQGLTAADRIAYQDAAKLLNEQMVSTGNLRSGAAAFGQSELLRRVVADAESRSFSQQMQKLGLLFGGSQELSNVGATQGQLGVAGKRLAVDVLGSAFNLSQSLAGAELRKGAALSNMIGSVGRLGDSASSAIAGAVAGGMGALPGLGATPGGPFSWEAAGLGSLLGSGSGGGLSQYMLMRNMLGGAPAK